MSCLRVLLLSTMPFYAVRVGRKPGIYKTWPECKAQVDNYPNPRFKKFNTEIEAFEFIQAKKSERSFAASPKSFSTNFKSKSASTSSYTRKAYSTTTPSQRRTKLIDHPSHFDAPVNSFPVVYSDGCCYNNGKRGARAGVGVFWAPEHPRNLRERLEGPQTNQRAELTAAIRALEGALAMNLSAIELRTDSMYTINAMTSWIKAWKKNGWTSSRGEAVKNQEDIRKLDSLCQKIKVEWVHVAGHSGEFGNEEADRLSKQGAEMDLPANEDWKRTRNRRL